MQILWNVTKYFVVGKFYHLITIIIHRDNIDSFQIYICWEWYLDNRMRTKMNHTNTLPIYQKCFNKHRSIIRLAYHFQSKSPYSLFIFVNYLNCWTLIRCQLHLSQKYHSVEDIAKYILLIFLSAKSYPLFRWSINKSRCQHIFYTLAHVSWVKLATTTIFSFPISVHTVV